MPNAKPVELAPNASLAGVPKVVAVVVAAPPNVNGAGAGVGEGAATAAATLAPNPKGFAAVAPGKVDAAGDSNVDLPKEKADWLAGAAAVVVVALVMPKPPKDAVVAIWAGEAWPKENAPCVLAGGAGCVVAGVVVIAPNAKALLLVAVVGAVGATEATVVAAVPNWKVLPVAGVGAAVDTVLVAVAALQFPNRDLMAGWAAGLVVAVVEAGVLAVLLVRPVNSERVGAAVLLLVKPPNSEEPLTVREGATVAAGALQGCPKAPLTRALPKMGLKVETSGLLSATELAGAGAVVVAPKIGLNTSGLLLMAEAIEVAGVEVRAGEEAAEEAGVADGFTSLNSPAPPKVGIVLGGLAD